VRKVVAFSLALVLLLALANPAYAQASLRGEMDSTRQVVLIIAPYVSWEDISSTKTPHIFAAMETAAIGNLNARSRVKDFDGKPSLLEGALSISSGAWPRADANARQSYDLDEVVDGVSSADMYTRLTGNELGDAQIAYLGLPRINAVNAGGDYTVIPGLLGSAIENAGGVSAAIGNSDLGRSYTAERHMRPAALIAMNREGLVRLGSVSSNLLISDEIAPYGVRTNREAMVEQMRAVAQSIKVNQPSLIVIDPGDLYRAETSAKESSSSAFKANWADALITLDEMYRCATEIYPSATIILAGQASLNPQLKREGLGPIIFSQPGALSVADRADSSTEPGALPTADRADASAADSADASAVDSTDASASQNTPSSAASGWYLESDSTKRRGLSTNLDLSASLYALLEVSASLEVIGAPFETQHSFDDRQEYLIKSNNTALVVDSLRGSVVSTFIWAVVMLLIAGAFALLRANEHWKELTVKRVRSIFRVLILGCLSVPAASWCMFLFNAWPQTQTAVLTQLLISTAILWALSLLVLRLRGGASGVVFLAAITAAVIAIDQLFGAPFSYSGFFSYSPILAFRFYGLGNEGAALIFGATVMAYALWLDRVKNPSKYSTWFLAAVGFFVVLICAAPWWGANVGMAAWGVIGFAVFFLLANDMKITWRKVLLILALVVLIVGAFILIDRFGSSGETHLARAIGSAEQGGLAPLLEIIARKAATNFRVLTASLWSIVVVAIFGFLLAMRLRPNPELARTLKTNRFFGHGMTAILVGGIVAFFTEDSGIVLPAIMVIYLASGLLWLMLERLHGKSTSSDTPCLGSAEAS